MCFGFNKWYQAKPDITAFRIRSKYPIYLDPHSNTVITTDEPLMYPKKTIIFAIDPQESIYILEKKVNILESKHIEITFYNFTNSEIQIAPHVTLGFLFFITNL